MCGCSVWCSGWGAITGLLLIGLGTGGIKPCVAAFGGDQMGENQRHLLEGYFAMFYFSINCGATLSSLMTPKLRADVECFGRTDCFPLAFGLPAILMLVALIIFWLGRGYVRANVCLRAERESRGGHQPTAPLLPTTPTPTPAHASVRRL